MKSTLILCLVLLVGVVSGAPANKKEFQHALCSPWSRVVMRALHYEDPVAPAHHFFAAVAQIVASYKYGD